MYGILILKPMVHAVSGLLVIHILASLVPRPTPFWLHEECGGPGIFSHVHDNKVEMWRKRLN